MTKLECWGLAVLAFTCNTGKDKQAKPMYSSTQEDNNKICRFMFCLFESLQKHNLPAAASTTAKLTKQSSIHAWTLFKFSDRNIPLLWEKLQSAVPVHPTLTLREPSPAWCGLSGSHRAINTWRKRPWATGEPMMNSQEWCSSVQALSRQSKRLPVLVWTFPAIANSGSLLRSGNKSFIGTKLPLTNEKILDLWKGSGIFFRSFSASRYIIKSKRKGVQDKVYPMTPHHLKSHYPCYRNAVQEECKENSQQIAFNVQPKRVDHSCHNFLLRSSTLEKTRGEKKPRALNVEPLEYPNFQPSKYLLPR